MRSAIKALDVAGAAGWSISRCARGCLHLHLGRTTVTLSPEELRELRELLARAELELTGQPASAVRETRPH